MTDGKIELKITLDDTDVRDGLAEAGTDAQDSSAKVAELGDEAVRTKTKVTDMDTAVRTVDLAAQIAIIQGFQQSLSQSISAMRTLGLVSDGTADTLMKVNAGLQLVNSAVVGIKALKAATAALNAQEAIHNALLTFKSVLSNPAKLALVGVAGTAAAAVIGGSMAYFSSKGGDTVSNTTTINISNDSQQKETASEIFRIVDGGAL